MSASAPRDSSALAQVWLFEDIVRDIMFFNHKKKSTPTIELRT